jgi:serine/arginine repetitive matrix protein 2
MEQTASKSRWEKVKQSLTRSNSRTGRRSRNNSIGARDNTLSMVSCESGISQGSARGGKDGMLSTQQATPPTLSPSPSTTLLDLTSGKTIGRSNPAAPVSAVSAADPLRYVNSKLFPFPGIVKLEEEHNRSKNITLAESANAPSPDIALTAFSGADSSGVVPTSTWSNNTARLERRLSRQRSHASRVANALAPPIPASAGNSQGSQHEHPGGRLDMPELADLASLQNLKSTGEKGVKRWFTTSKKLFSPTSPTPAGFNRGGQQSAFGRFTSHFRTKSEAGHPGSAS